MNPCSPASCVRPYRLSPILAGLAAGLLLSGALSAAPAIQTARFDKVALSPSRDVNGVVVARNETRVSTEIAGTVLRWGADTGGTVRRGEMLVEIDPTDLRLARDRARAGLSAAQARAALAQQQLQRAQDLVAQGFFSREALAARETDRQLAQADLAAAQLALASAERALGKARIVAPFDASVRQRLAQTGEALAPGAPVYLLAQTTGAELSAQLSPEDADSLRQARETHFKRSDGSQVALRLLRVASTLNPATRTVEVRLAAATDQGPLVPGRDGRLVWTDPRPHVPAALLVRRDGALGVFAVEQGKAVFMPLARAQEGRAAASDMPAATELVTQGHQSLRDGEVVTR